LEIFLVVFFLAGHASLVVLHIEEGKEKEERERERERERKREREREREREGEREKEKERTLEKISTIVVPE